MSYAEAAERQIKELEAEVERLAAALDEARQKAQEAKEAERFAVTRYLLLQVTVDGWRHLYRQIRQERDELRQKREATQIRAGICPACESDECMADGVNLWCPACDASYTLEEKE